MPCYTQTSYLNFVYKMYRPSVFTFFSSRTEVSIFLYLTKNIVFTFRQLALLTLDTCYHPARIFWLTGTSLHDFVFISPVSFVLRFIFQPAFPGWERGDEKSRNQNTLSSVAEVE